MSVPAHVPPMADAWLVGNPNAGAFVAAPPRIVLHTTETRGMPNYSDGKSAPHDTLDPTTGFMLSHIPHNLAARSLRNDPSTGIQTNKQCAHQLEIICYSDKTKADKYPDALWVGDLTDEQYEMIAEWIVWVHLQYGVPNSFRMPRPPARWGADSPSRMTENAWAGFSGWAGHFEVPKGNKHWDTGALDFPRLLVAVEKILQPTPPPGPTGPTGPPIPPPPMEEEMIEELTKGLVPDDINKLVDAGIVLPKTAATKKYWIDLLADPESTEWRRFWANLYVQTALRANG